MKLTDFLPGFKNFSEAEGDPWKLLLAADELAGSIAGPQRVLGPHAPQSFGSLYRIDKEARGGNRLAQLSALTGFNLDPEGFIQASGVKFAQEDPKHAIEFGSGSGGRQETVAGTAPTEMSDGFDRERVGSTLKSKIKALPTEERPKIHDPTPFHRRKKEKKDFYANPTTDVGGISRYLLSK